MKCDWEPFYSSSNFKIGIRCRCCDVLFTVADLSEGIQSIADRTCPASPKPMPVVPYSLQSRDAGEVVIGRINGLLRCVADLQERVKGD